MAQLADYAFDSRGIAFPLNPLSKRNSHQKYRESSIYFFLRLAVHLQYGDTLRELHLRLFNIRGGQPAKAKKDVRGNVNLWRTLCAYGEDVVGACV